jgi:YT521-B-like domain
VFLIFGVNKSGEFYGYARSVLGFVSLSHQSDLAYRMAGPILHSEDRVPFASRPASFVSLPRPSAVSDVEGNVPISPPARIEENQDLHYAFTAEERRVVGQSPKAISQSQEEVPRAKVQAAELRDLHHRPTGARAFELSADAPYRSIRDGPDHQAGHPTNPALSGESDDILEYVRDSQPVAEELTKDPKEGLADGWGRPFRVDWIRTKHLSFIRTKHLRNPWNNGREVKISRDGTELEPSIGRQLLEEWDKRSTSPADIPVVSSPTALERRNSL